MDKNKNDTHERLIPFVDDGVKDTSDNTYENLKKFYTRCHVGEYLHTTEKGKCLKFEFGNMLAGYDVGGGEEDENGHTKENPIVRKLSYIEINKKSFMHNMNTSVRYINYFIEYFDYDDELMNAYFSIMFVIMNNEVDLDPLSFVEFIWAYFDTPTMIDKVISMVEYNVDENLIKKSDRKYDESIQLTTEHLKAIMGVSCLHKFVIPIVSQYFNIKKAQLTKEKWTDKDMYYYAFSGFIHSFDEYYDISLYDKLYHTATTRVSKTENGDATMWKRRQRVGTTPVVFSNKLMRDFIIDISQKVVFNRSAIIFIHVCFDHAISTELIQRDPFEFSDMSTESSDSVNETISSFDRVMTENTHHHQGEYLRACVAIEDSIYRLGNEVGLDFNLLNDKGSGNRKERKKLRAEYDFYRENTPQLTDAQMYIIDLYYSSRLKSASDARQIEMRDVFKLIMIMKRDFTRRNYTYLAQFISGNLKPVEKSNTNKRRLDKLFNNHPLHDDLMEEYSDTTALLNVDKIYNQLKVLLSCSIVIVNYDDKNNGHRLAPNDECAVDEFMRFLKDI